MGTELMTPGRNSIIEMLVSQEPYYTLRARQDHAKITGKKFIEKVIWFRNTDTGQLYHSLFPAIGWPAEIKDQDKGQSGYICVVGVVKPKVPPKSYKTLDAKFQIIDEFQSKDVQVLLDEAVKMRERMGFGVTPELVSTWYGDADRFLTTLSLLNERLIMGRGEEYALTVTPPVDYYDPFSFDQYVRSIKSCILGNRLFFGDCDIIRNKLRRFDKDDPAIGAVGGLVHTLLTQVMWMDATEETSFNVDEED